MHAHTLRFQVKNFDPVAEAFKVYDPSNTGFVDTEVLREIFQSLGFGEITDDGKRDACHRIAICSALIDDLWRILSQISRSLSRRATLTRTRKLAYRTSVTCLISTRLVRRRATKRRAARDVADLPAFGVYLRNGLFLSGIFGFQKQCV